MMKYIAGTKEGLEALRAAVEAVLGYPRMPDVIGANVRDPQPTVHEWGIEDVQGGALMTVDESLDDAAKDTRIGADVRKMLAMKLKAKMDKYDPVQAETIEEAETIKG